MEPYRQLKKTRVMVFQKKKKWTNKLNSIYNDHPIDMVAQYSYLGITISASGNLRSGVELSEKARRAVVAIRRKFMLSKLPINMVNKLFQSFLFPVLTYCRTSCKRPPLLSGKLVSYGGGRLRD